MENPSSAVEIVVNVKAAIDGSLLAFIERRTAMLIKICGITTEEEIVYLNEWQVDYAGFVQFFPKSKRNITTRQARKLLDCLDRKIKSVAVTVSPSAGQIRELAEAGFDYIQIHGQVEDSLLEESPVPVFKAFNVKDLADFSHYETLSNVAGYVFDAQLPGSGRAFDWNLVKKLPETDRITLLAGGLNPDNVEEALRAVNVCGVDTSSGVENKNGIGKSREKIGKFVERVRTLEK